MFSSSRHCFDGKTALAPFLEQATPSSTPLLFLYPRCFRTSSRRSHGAAPAKPSQDSLTLPAERGGSGTHRNTRAQHSEAAAYDRGDEDRANGSRVLESSTDWSRSWTVHTRSGRASRRGFGRPERQSGTPTLAEIVRERLERKTDHDDPIHGMQAKRRNGEEDGSLTRVPTMRSPKRSVMRDKYDPKRLLWTAHLRGVAQVLARLRHQRTMTPGETISLSEATIFQLTGSVDENIWIHHVREGCKIHVLPRTDDSPSTQRRVRLTGSDLAVELTRKYLLGCQETLGAASTSSPEFRYLIPRGRLVVKTAREKAQVLRQPTEWTVRTLAQHIKDLVTTRLSRGLKRDLYQDGYSFNQEIADTLQKLCTDPHLEPCLSSRAITLALWFLCRHTELLPAAHAIYARSQHLRLNRHVEGFNLLLASALRTNDLEFFRELISDMADMHVLPNASTWAKLLQVTDFPWARRRIVELARHPSTARTPEMTAELVMNLVEVDLAASWRRGQGLLDFVRDMDHTFGPQWLSTPVLNKMIRVCAQNRWEQYAAEVVELAQQRGIQFEAKTLLSLLKLAQKGGRLYEAIQLLRSPVAGILKPDLSATLPILFDIAWQKQFYNVCRVLWHCAASHGCITYPMQAKVTSTLVQNCPRSQQHERRSPWKMLAGKVIVGTDLDDTGFQEQFPRLSQYMTTSNPMEWLGRWTPDDGTRDEQRSLSYVMLHRDLAAWKTFKPLGYASVCRLLDEAYVRDGQWSTSGVTDQANLSEVLLNCVQVPLVRQNDRWRFEKTHASMPVPILSNPTEQNEDSRQDTRQDTQQETPELSYVSPTLSGVNGSVLHNLTPDPAEPTPMAPLSIFRRLPDIRVQLHHLSPPAPATSFRMPMPRVSWSLGQRQLAHFSTYRITRGWTSLTYSLLHTSPQRCASTATAQRLDDDSLPYLTLSPDSANVLAEADGTRELNRNDIESDPSDISLATTPFTESVSPAVVPSTAGTAGTLADNVETGLSDVPVHLWLASSRYRRLCYLDWYMTTHLKMLTHMRTDVCSQLAVSTDVDRALDAAHRSCYLVGLALGLLDFELVEIWHNLGIVSGERFQRLQHIRARADLFWREITAARQEVRRLDTLQKARRRKVRRRNRPETGGESTVHGDDAGELRSRPFSGRNRSSREHEKPEMSMATRAYVRTVARQETMSLSVHGNRATVPPTARRPQVTLAPPDATMQELLSQIQELRMESRQLRQVVEQLHMAQVGDGRATRQHEQQEPKVPIRFITEQPATSPSEAQNFPPRATPDDDSDIASTALFTPRDPFVERPVSLPPTHVATSASSREPPSHSIRRGRAIHFDRDEILVDLARHNITLSPTQQQFFDQNGSLPLKLRVKLYGRLAPHVQPAPSREMEEEETEGGQSHARPAPPSSRPQWQGRAGVARAREKAERSGLLWDDGYEVREVDPVA